MTVTIFGKKWFKVQFDFSFQFSLSHVPLETESYIIIYSMKNGHSFWDLDALDDDIKMQK